VTFFIKVLVKLQAQLSSVYPYRAILQGTVIGGLVEQCVADMLLGQFVGIPVDRLLGNELQQISQPGALLEGWAGNNSLYELPALITQEVVSGFWLRNRRLR
jgi:hypothetical protein